MGPYVRLYRADVAVISFLAYLVGILLSSNAVWMDIFPGLLISFVSFNFIYSFNAWSDRKIDKINKPHRPIPSGLVNPGNALRYSLVLFAFSLLYPLFLSESLWEYGLYAALPSIGIVYSANPLRIRRYALPSTLLVALAYTIPVLLGWGRHRPGFHMPDFSLSLFVYALAIIPLKDIEDKAGDLKCQIQNWANLLGRDALVACSIALLIAGCFHVVMSVDIAKPLFLVHFIVTIVFLASFRFLAKNKDGLYRPLLWVVACSGIVLSATWVVMNR